jgi:hypothetical protein
VVWDENDSDVTAAFRVPGAPGTRNRVVYRFEGGWLAREDLPLTGGGRAEEQLGSLWVVAERDVADLEMPATPWTRRLRGPNAEAFQVHGIAAGTALADELPGGFTVTLPEPATGIRRHYESEAALALRDLPLELPGGQRGYLRVGVGARQGRLQVVGEDGAPLTGWHAVRLGENRVAVGPANAAVPRGNRVWMLLDPETGRPVEDRGGHAFGGLLPMVFRNLDDAPQ